jgi:hypothetical protein
MQSPFTPTPDGVTWTHQLGDIYLVTGHTSSGKRFRFQTDKWSVANALNIYCGTKWLVRNGKRFRILSIHN